MASVDSHTVRCQTGWQLALGPLPLHTHQLIPLASAPLITTTIIIVIIVTVIIIIIVIIEMEFPSCFPK